MKISCFSPLFLILLALLFSVTCAVSASAEDDSKEAQHKLEELTRKAEQTSDLNELMKIQRDMMDLMNQMLSRLPKGGPGMPVAQGKTPGEEVDRRIEAINRGYRDIIGTIHHLRDEKTPLVPLARASRIRGSIVVTGKDSEPPYRGWVWVDLSYRVKEEFVGYLIVTEHYDPKTGRLTDRRDYAVHSISTGINVISQGGKQCLGASSEIPGHCTEWGHYTAHDIGEGNEYPAIHEWVIMGSSEGERVSIDVESPSVHFRSADGLAGRGLGCYGTRFEMTKSEFETALQEGKFEDGKEVGHKFRGSPHCDTGSEINLSVKLCDPRPYAEMDRCEQMKSLLASTKALIRLRNAFKEMAAGAKDEDHLADLVLLEMGSLYPGEEWGEKYVKESGSYNLCTGQITLPEPCKGCAPRPLCEWYHRGLEIHEKTHHADAQGNLLIKKYFCDPLFVPTDLQSREKAKIWADLDYHAYDEQLKYYRDILEEELSGNVECRFEPSFFSDLAEAVTEIGK